jgi:Tfp pilus assembly protein PilF
MRCSRQRALKRLCMQAMARGHLSWLAMRFLIPIMPIILFAFPVFSQDARREEDRFHGNGAEITVNVHDSSGQPISSVAMVKVYREGSIPSGQAQTSHGAAVLIVNTLGDFNLVVSAPGYTDAQKEVLVRVSGRMQVDVYLSVSSVGGTFGRPPGRPVLAPKAQQAIDKGLQALSADRMAEAEKYLSEATRLAPGHPDVLYVRGVLWLKQRNWKQAQSALEQATQMDPVHARAFAALGMAFCDQGMYDKAIAPLEKSLQLDSVSTWETRWALAKAYYQRERYEQALALSQQALEGSSGKEPAIVLLVAQALTAVGRYEEAATTLRNFVAVHGDSRDATTARRWLERLTASGKIRPL